MATSSPPDDSLESLLTAARLYLRGGDLAQVDPELPSLVSVLVDAGAGECYHEHSTFLAHLLDVYRILRLWGAPDAVVRCGLFHSYSNSHVNLAMFKPDVSRDRVRFIIGTDAEQLVHLFCIVPCHKLMHEDLHHRYTDDELRDHLARALLQQQQAFQAAAAGTGTMMTTVETEPWQEKLRSVVLLEGMVVPHIRMREPVALSRRVLVAFVLMTIADFSDQYTDLRTICSATEDGL